MPLSLLDVVSDPDFQWLPEQEKFKAFRQLGPQDAAWSALPNDKKMEIMAASGIKLAVNAYHRKKALEDQQANAPSMLRRATDRLAAPVEGVVETAKKIANRPEDQGTMKTLGQYGMGALQAASVPFQVASEVVGLGREGVGRAFGEDPEVAEAQGDVFKAGSDVVQTVAPLADLPSVGKLINPNKKLPVMNTESGPIEQNAPPPIKAQEDLNASIAAKGVDPSDTKAVVDSLADDAGIPRPASVTVGKAPISSSQMVNGKPTIDLAEGAPYEALHEIKHLEADVKGTPQPPENNAAIVAQHLKKGEMFENRGRSYIVQGYDEDLGTYTVKDQKTGMLTEMPEESAVPAIAKRGPEPVPSGTISVPNGEAPPPVEGAPAAPKEMPITPPEAKTNPAGPVKRVATNIMSVWKAAAASKSAGDIVVSGTLRTAVHGLAKASSEGFARVRGVDPGLLGDPWEGFKMLTDIASRKSTGKVIRGLESQKMFLGKMDKPPVDMSEDLGRFMQNRAMQVGEGSGAVGKITDKLSVFNRLGDIIPKTGILVGRLRSNLAARGLVLEDLVAQGRLGEIKAEELADAIEMGNKLIFAAEPKNAVASALVNAFRHPALSPFVPFPRILYNKLATAAEMGPHVLFKYLKPENAAKLAHGDPKAAYEFAMGSLGTALIGVGYEMRKNGPDFMTVKLGDKTKLDLKYFVLNPWLILGSALYDVDHEPAGDPKAWKQTVNDAVRALVGTPGSMYSAAAGLLESWVMEDDRTGALGRGEMGGWLSGFTQPFSILKDVLGEFDQEERKQRDAGGMAKPLEKLPFVAGALPERKMVTKEATPERKHPLLNLAGIPLQEANTPVQDELDKYNIRTVIHPFGDDEANREYRDVMSKTLPKVVEQKMAEKGYAERPDIEKRKILEALNRGMVQKAKVEALRRIKKNHPEEKERIKRLAMAMLGPSVRAVVQSRAADKAKKTE